MAPSLCYQVATEVRSMHDERKGVLCKKICY